MLLFIVMCGMVAQPVLTFSDEDSAIRHFYDRPYKFADVPISDKGDLLWILCDVTQDGRDDIVITGTNIRTGDWDWLCWDVYKGEADGGFKVLMWGMTFDPEDVLVVKDEAGVKHLATVRPFSQTEMVVTALELENERSISSRAFRDLSTESAEDMAWLEEQRQDANGMVRRISAEELARKYPAKAAAESAPPIDPPTETEVEPEGTHAASESAAAPSGIVEADGKETHGEEVKVLQAPGSNVEEPVDFQLDPSGEKPLETSFRGIGLRLIVGAGLLVGAFALFIYYRRRGRE
jgi:hypothetical protein